MRGFQKSINELRNKNIILPKLIANKLNEYNLFSPEDIIIPAKSKVKINTGIKIIFPKEEDLAFKPTTTLALSNEAKLITNFFHNEIDAVLTLWNDSEQEFKLNKGDIFCQAIFQRV